MKYEIYNLIRIFCKIFEIKFEKELMELLEKELGEIEESCGIIYKTVF